MDVVNYNNRLHHRHLCLKLTQLSTSPLARHCEERSNPTIQGDCFVPRNDVSGFQLLICALIMFIFPLFVSAQKTLDLSNQELTEIPQSVRNMRDLEELDLSENPLVNLPLWFSELKNLTTIRLNKVTALAPNQAFKVLATCENLQEIYWNDAQLIYLPFAVNHIKKLKKLEISGNGILKLPPFKNNTSLEFLDVSDNLLDSLDLTFTQLKNLKHLNFSFNPGMENKFNYHLLSFIPTLNSLTVDGLKNIPTELNKLQSLQFLSLNDGEFSSLPDNLTGLKNLNYLSVKNCLKVDLSSLIEQLTALPKLNSLGIGYVGFDKVPYNLFKLTALKNLIIQKGCLSYFPESFSKLNLQTLNIQNCTMNNFPDLIQKISSIKTLKELILIDIKTNESNWDLTDLQNLKVLDLSDNHLKKTPTGINPNTRLFLDGNEIHSTFELKGNVFKNLKFKEANDIYTHRKTIYAQVGDAFYYKGYEFEIPPLAFVDKNGKNITEEVELNIQIINTPVDIALSNLPLFTQNFSPLALSDAIYITCLYKKQVCYIRTDKSIKISTNAKNQLGVYQYNTFKNHLEELKTKALECSNHEQKHEDFDFKSIVAANKKEFPELPFKVKTSKVHISLKKNLRKNTLNFDITPQYGYKENFFQLFGDRIKGYPELKTYEGIRWNYAGDDMERDLQKIYFLSEQAKSEKLERNSAFYFYVLDIKDIFLKAHPTKDCYVMSIVQGMDTLNIDVLPYVNIVQAKKIQKWHEKKFEKYSSELIERKAYWLKLDSLYLNQFEDYEEKLNDFRNTLINPKSSILESTWRSNVQHSHTKLEINKTGLYIIAYPLSVSDFTTHQLQFEISGHKHFPKYVLVHNSASGKSYWQESNNVRIENKGTSTIFSLVGDILYVGTYENNDLIKLQK